MKARIRVGDRVEIGEGHYWPHGKFGTVVRKDPIISGKRIISHWFVVQQDPGEDPRMHGEPTPMLFPRSHIELHERRTNHDRSARSALGGANRAGMLEAGEGDQRVGLES